MKWLRSGSFHLNPGSFWVCDAALLRTDPWQPQNVRISNEDSRALPGRLPHRITVLFWWPVFPFSKPFPALVTPRLARASIQSLGCSPFPHVPAQILACPQILENSIHLPCYPPTHTETSRSLHIKDKCLCVCIMLAMTSLFCHCFKFCEVFLVRYLTLQGKGLFLLISVFPARGMAVTFKTWRDEWTNKPTISDIKKITVSDGVSCSWPPTGTNVHKAPMSLYEVVKQPCIEAVSLHAFYSLDHQPSAIPLQERCLVQLEARDLHPAGRTLSLTLVEQSYRISTFPPNLCSVLDQELREGRDYLTFLFSDDTWVRF